MVIFPKIIKTTEISSDCDDHTLQDNHRLTVLHQIFRSSKHFNFPIEPIIFPKLSQCRKVNLSKGEHPHKSVVLIMRLQLSRK